MQRRKFFEKLGVASAAVISAPSLTAEAAPQDHEHGHGRDEKLSGALANATVSFGAWQSKDNDAVAPQNAELDRFPNLSPAGRNSHRLIPFEATITAGGSVNFIISGLHQPIVYTPGKDPEEVNQALTRPTTGTPAGLALINDPVSRVFAGLDPSLQPRDRVEVVEFPNPGRHLVICGVLPHFQEGMYGYVRVLRRSRG